jgi:hypothetical protein
VADSHFSPEVIATVGDVQITRAEYERELNERASRSPGVFQDSASRERLLNSIIERKTLYSKAVQDGFDRHPDIVALTEALIASKYREARWDGWSTTLTEVQPEEIAAYYHAHAEQFTRPAMVRAGVLRIGCSPKLSPEKQAEALHRAEALLAQARQGSDDDFRQLVQLHSEDQSSRYTGGDTGWLVQEESPLRWPPEVVQAAFELDRIGEVAPLVRSADALHIIRLNGRREKALQPLSEVEAAISHRLEQERQVQVREAFFDDLQEGQEVTVNESLLKTITPTTQVQTASVPCRPGP